MPSPPGYKRNYKQEYKTELSRHEDVGNALRHRARRLETKRGLVKPGDHKDVDHIKPLSKGGSGAADNLRVESVHKNRSYHRTSTGAIKS